MSEPELEMLMKLSNTVIICELRFKLQAQRLAL